MHNCEIYLILNPYYCVLVYYYHFLRLIDSVYFCLVRLEIYSLVSLSRWLRWLAYLVGSRWLAYR